MTSRRIFLLKCGVAACLVFLVVHMLSNPQTTSYIRLLQQSGENLAALDSGGGGGTGGLETALPIKQAPVEETVPPTGRVAVPYEGDDDSREDGRGGQPPPSVMVGSTETILSADNSTIPFSFLPPPTTTLSPSQLLSARLRLVTQCLDRPLVARTQQRGDYWVLYNYVPASRAHRCHDSVTYTTHADFSFLDNVVPLVERWRGPVSIALHAPGTDFARTLAAIGYLRECGGSTLVKELVTFHVYFSTRHVPKEVPRHSSVLETLAESYSNCSAAPPYLNVSSDSMYKSQKKLLYPVNVGRNVARDSAQTHFLLASDIELYPSPGLIGKFLTLIAANEAPLAEAKRPRVFPLHLFEINGNESVPETKSQLQEMLKNGTAFPFHKKLCPGCHNVPKSREWQKENETEGLHVYHVGKRIGNFLHWEPIFIGTHLEPLYDERLSWEGKSDKMTQGYALCVLDYDFMILDNAFLIHKPGIKVYKRDPKRAVLSSKTNQLIKKIIFPELKVLYGTRKGCAV